MLKGNLVSSPKNAHHLHDASSCLRLTAAMGQHEAYLDDYIDDLRQALKTVF